MTKQKSQRLPGYKRAKEAPGMRLTDRDQAIFHTIYRYDGMLSLDQIHRWFFGAKRRAQRRISILFHNGYLQRPKREELYRIPEPIVWLGKLGAEVVAQQLGLDLAKLHWRKEPRQGDVAHDIGQNEVRHTIETAASQTAEYEILEWYGRDDLWRTVGAQPIAYLAQDGSRQEKRVVPDGYFRLEVRNQSEQIQQFRFLLEFDNKTFSQARFVRDKVSPNMHLVLSAAYEHHIGAKGGRFLVVAKGSEDRFNNMREAITQAGGAPYFLLAQAEALTVENALDRAVWQLPHHDRRISLIEYGNPEFQRWLAKSVKDLPRLPILRELL